MTIRNVDTNHLTGLLEMACDLWPDTAKEDLENTLQEEFNSDRHHHFIAVDDNDECIGFISLSLRSDYVEGSSGSPVAYIEGIYVKPAYRRLHVAEALVQAGIGWGRQKGCMEIASDTPVNNTESQHFHERIGFQKAGVIVHYIRNIG
ncbi:aminoglycoside 6'-N-acetyltransferase [Foetidibacter luteolus]|uniref:aminoglycoside 6'-N-acetyltransferase n=1 Tax=Foetidibacter luteolus TaxID=2608880 RepID=UPI00129B4A7D|nr:aminoglycoside 6'-N-acetyltransferase [Foetidibacter luteolus]